MSRVRVLVVIAFLSIPCLATPQGMPLGPEFRVNTYTTGLQGTPGVAADPSGNFIVAWSSLNQDGSGNGVFGQRYDSSGAPVGPEFRVNTFVSASQSIPVAAADTSGAFVVVWMSFTQDGSDWGIFGQRYAASGAPLGSEFRVNTFTTGRQWYPAIAADPSGNFVVVWGSDAQDGSGYGVYAQRYASSGIPVGPEFRVNTSTTLTQFLPRVASDSSGNFVVVWESDGQDGSSGGIFGQRYSSSGAPLGPEFQANTYTTDIQSRPAVASDTSGNFIVVWASLQDGSGYGVFGQRYAASGTPQGLEFAINTYTTGIQERPSVAADSSGSFVVVWESLQDGSDYGVFGQRYLSSGTPLGPEFRVNTYTTSDQFHPSVAADPSGNFVVVWISDLEDGSNLGEFGQRYGQIVPVELMHAQVE